MQQTSVVVPSDAILCSRKKKKKNYRKGFSALNRGGLIDKLVSAKPAFANCLSNALINQTEE